MVPFVLRRCPQCDEFHGWALDPDGFLEVLCLCRGIVCRTCRAGAIHRPFSNYFDQTTGLIIHVPTFGYLMRCRHCRKSGKTAAPTRGLL